MKSPQKVAALIAEITELLAKEAVTVVSREQRNSRLYSPYFLVSKKDRGMRPILDLRVRNESVAKRPFRMLTTKRLLECIHNKDFCISIDLKDAYCICADTSASQEVSPFCLSRGGIRVCEDAIRVRPGTPHLFQMCGGGIGTVASSRDKATSLPR